MSTYISSLLYEVCWGFEYLPLRAHINVKLGLKPPSKGREIHLVTVLVPQVCEYQKPIETDHNINIFLH